MLSGCVFLRNLHSFGTIALLLREDWMMDVPTYDSRAADSQGHHKHHGAEPHTGDVPVCLAACKPQTKFWKPRDNISEILVK